jgi:hypothetical protein
LHVWVKPVRKKDTLDFLILSRRDTVFKGTRIATAGRKDSLLLKQRKNKIYPLDTLEILASVPLIRIDSGKIVLKSGQSFETKISPQGVLQIIPNRIIENQKDTIVLYPGAIRYFLSQTRTDTLVFPFSVFPGTATGNLKLLAQNIPPGKEYIVQLVKIKPGEVVREVHTENFPVEFTYLPPGRYRIRIIADENRNGFWDTGNTERKKQPEPVYHYPGIIEIRANWNVEEKFVLPLD